MPLAGVVDALERIHAALADDGVVVDTQPVGAEPPIVCDRGLIGALDMREWSHTIAAVDQAIMQVVERGLFEVSAERVVVVADAYDDLAELVAHTGEWAGTKVPADVASRALAEPGPVRLDQDIRVRLLTRLQA